ncbi:MAG: ABC transporter ATP-binding protein [Campylobacterota bacterium]|nr:ABC transporter ATP-binding protein [Campylobacterota bacterium]
MLIKIENLKKSFGDHVVLDNISLEIKQGDRVAILGQSGCGKTTLLNEIKNDNKQMQKFYSDFSIVYQEPRLLAWKTVLENVTLVCNDEQKARKLLDEVELSEHLNKFPCEISGGMKQRVSIARALSMDPEVLFLDEPFSALDLKIRVNLIKMLAKELTHIQSLKGLVYVTHNILDALLLANKVIVLGGSPSRIVYEKDIHIPLGQRDWKDQELIEIEQEITKIFLD